MDVILKPCPICGQIPRMCGMRKQEYVDGKWVEAEEEFWVRPNCLPYCYLGIVHVKAFGKDGIRYHSPESAAKAWNKSVHKPENTEVKNESILQRNRI